MTRDKKTVIVTGGAGFVGSHLCARLAKDGHRVISLDNYFTGSRENHVEGVEYREGHTKDIALLIPEMPDIIYHLGEYSRVEVSFKEPALVWDLNKDGTFGVLEFWRKKKPKLVYAGSSTKFADGGLGRDQSPYAWTKASNTELVRNYSAWFGLPYAIVYFYNVYGPGERAGAYGTVVEIFRQKFLHGEQLTVEEPGTQDDFGIGDEHAYTILELANMFGSDIVMTPMCPGNRMNSVIDTSKMHALGWSVKHSLKDYVASIVAKRS
jgi:UDP-glucose 4-epimerase